MKYAFLNQLQEGIVVIDKHYNIQFCNKSILQNLNYKLDELEGKCIEHIMLLAEVDNIIQKNEVVEFQKMQLITHENEILNVKGNIVNDEWEGKEAFVVVINTYSSYSIEVLEEILDNLPYGVWLCDKDNQYIYMNQNMVRFRERLSSEYKPDLSYEGVNHYEYWEGILPLEVIEKDKEKLNTNYIITENRQVEIWETQIKYNIMKLPIISRMGEVETTLSIFTGIIYENDIENILNDEEYHLYKNSKIILEKKNNDILHLTGAESLLICEYDPEKQVLQGLFRITKTPNKLTNQFIINISVNRLKEIVQDKCEWNLEEFSMILQYKDMVKLKKLGIQYIYTYPIIYKEEIMGIVIGAYKEKYNCLMMERQLIYKMSKYLGTVLKNNKLSKSVENELKKRKAVEDELELFLELAADYICVLDENGNFIKGNTVWWQKTGYDFSDMYIELPDGMKKIVATKYVGEEEEKQIWELLKELKKNPGRTQDINRWQGENGEFVWIQWDISYIEEKKNYFIIGKDVTELINNKNEKMMCQETLAIEILKNQFIANISHELKTPLNVLHSALQLVDDEAKKAEWVKVYPEEARRWKKHRHVALQNILRLIRLVDNIIDISDIKAGRHQGEKGNYNIIELIENTTMSVIEYANKKELEVVFDTQVEELIMACNPDSIERIILNLLSNAIKYTEEGNILVDVSIKEKKLLIEVKDTGIGIPEECMGIIFSHFEQVDKSFRRLCEGSGMGLAIVKAFVEEHNGKVYVESQLEKGSVFRVELPIIRVEGEEVREIPDCFFISQKSRLEFSDLYY